jgi:nicotinate-nucleotide adenylyltransferase
MIKKLGFFGGCFNPVTVAHISLIRLAIEECNLDKVYFIPMGDLYSKPDLISAEHRYNMLCIATKNEPKMEVLRTSIDSKQNNKAIDTFKIIENNFKDSENYFIMGSDNYNNINNWKNSEELKQNYKYIILDRGNTNPGNYKLISENNIKTNSESCFNKKISSSLIRKNIKQERTVTGLILKDVENYIIKNQLYK